MGGIRRTRRLGALAVALALLCSISATPAWADNPNAPANQQGDALKVSGYVKLPGGTPVEGASITGGPLGAVLSDASGYYEVQFLGFGEYQLTATKPGMTSHSKTVVLTIQYTSQTADFHLKWLTDAVLNRTFISTAPGGFTLTQTITTYAPASSCALVNDSRTGATTSVPLSAGGAQSTGTWTANLPQNTPEGGFTLTTAITNCSSGIQIDVGATKNYLIDNTAPVLRNPIPADYGNTTSRAPTITTHAVEGGSGVEVSGVSMTLDGIPVAISGLPQTSDGVVVAYAAQNLRMGVHTVTVTTVDRAGNAAPGLSWVFLVTDVAFSSPPAAIDASSVKTVPLAFVPGDPLAIGTAVRVGQTEMTLARSGHPGFGLVCGNLDLSPVRAKFTKVDGTAVYVAPANLSPSTQSVCSYVIVPDVDTTDPVRVAIPARSYGLGALNFPVPLGTMPGSQAVVVFEAQGAPVVQWQAPCPVVNAAAGVAPSVPVPVCDPVPNYIDVDAGTGFDKTLQSQAALHHHDGYEHAGTLAVPSVWASGPAGWNLASPPIDVSHMQATDAVSQAITPVSPYAAAGGGARAVLLRTLETWVKENSDGTRGTSLVASFEWSPDYDGRAGHANYLATAWADGLTSSSRTTRLYAQTGDQIVASVDDAGNPIAWTAFDDTQRGAATGFLERFTLNGQSVSVSSGVMTVTTTDSQTCASCRVASQWFHVGGSTHETLAPTPGGIGVDATGPAPPEIVTESSGISWLCKLVGGNGTTQGSAPGGTGLPSTTNSDLCGGGGSGYTVPAETRAWYVNLDRFNTSSRTNRCANGNPQTFATSGSGCDIIYSMGYYATNGGMHVLHIGAPCTSGSGQGVTLFSGCHDYTTVANGLKEWFNGYVDNPAHDFGVRVAIGSSNSGNPTQTPFEQNGREAYERIWSILKPYSVTAADRSAHETLYFTVSGAFDVETPLERSEFRIATESLPWMQGWNRRANATHAEDQQMNLYNTGAVVNKPYWTTDQWGSGWTGYQFWQSMWGKGESDYDQNFPAPQNYFKSANGCCWAEAFHFLQQQAIENAYNDRLPNPSAVSWICHPPSTNFSDSRASFLDFRNDHGVWHSSDRPLYRLNVPDTSFTC